jgi:aspartyl-tRNA(Asn)/glutamyl-tRNA(Gln) amidotransferase subunit A
MGSSVVDLGGREENIVSACCRLVAPQNMTGVPAASIPCGMSNGLPIGLQIFAAAGADDVVLGVAHAYQKATDWHARHPDLSGETRARSGDRRDRTGPMAPGSP